MGEGGPKLDQSHETPNTSEIHLRRQTKGAKVFSQEGNSPDRTLRSLSNH